MQIILICFRFQNVRNIFTPNIWQVYVMHALKMEDGVSPRCIAYCSFLCFVYYLYLLHLLHFVSTKNVYSIICVCF